MPVKTEKNPASPRLGVCGMTTACTQHGALMLQAELHVDNYHIFNTKSSTVLVQFQY